MCFLTDANQLYNTALRLYDLDLALLVAQQAQKVRITYLRMGINLVLTIFLGSSRIPAIPTEVATNAGTPKTPYD